MRREIARRIDAGTLDRDELYRQWLEAVRSEKTEAERITQPAMGG